jgi:Ca2+-binding RTX toxin-like protein
MNNTYFDVKKSQVFNYQNKFSSSQWGVIAVLDYNRDGKMDFLAHAIHYDQSKEDQSLPMLFMKGSGDGKFELDTKFTSTNSPDVFEPRLVIDDFNSDGNKDIFVIDSGSTLGGKYAFKGAQSYIYFGTSNGNFNLQKIDGKKYYAKNASAIDVNNDGFLDIYVESGGESGNQEGTKRPPHFLINDGLGNFKEDLSRISISISFANWASDISDYYYQPIEKQGRENRYLGESFFDMNNDGFLDIVLPSMDHTDVPERTSKVVLNDTEGNFLTQNKIVLPEPNWNDGLLIGSDSTTGDIDNDGFADLIIGFTSFDYKGRYLQILKNNNGQSFTDITNEALGSQTLEKSDVNYYGGNNSNIRFQYRSFQLVDFNKDGYLDIFIGGLEAISPIAPILYLNNGFGKFVNTSLSSFGYNSYFSKNGQSQFLIDANVDGRLDVGFIDSNGSGLDFNIFLNNSGLLENIIGTSGSDVLSGSGAHETINGMEGDDSVDGGAGNDTINGGPGIDTVICTNCRNSISINLATGSVNSTSEKNISGIGIDKLFNIENIVSGNYHDNLLGSKINNRIEGSAGNDTLDGGLGKDTLVGGDGADTFVFSSKSSISNLDTIPDFQVGVDRIQLNRKVFAKLKVAADYLAFGTTSDSKSHYLIYDSASGKLSYDADGNVSKIKPVDIALIGQGLNLTIQDIVVF